MDNIGRIITDFYCNGYFGRNYDCSNAKIIAEGDEFIVIKKENGIVDFANFQNFNYNRNKDGSLSNGINSLTCMSKENKQKLIDSWCNEY